ncbi:MAG: hypothetical protein IK145_04575 [Bacteroidales bacterium]|nr:hypothetical protein [Bacteroidales bacterium]
MRHFFVSFGHRQFSPPELSLAIVKNDRAMNDTLKKIRKKKKSDEARQLSEDRLQLLYTIHEIISEELDNRGVTQEGNPHPENPPPGIFRYGSDRKTTRRVNLCRCIKKKPIPTSIV